MFRVLKRGGTRGDHTSLQEWARVTADRLPAEELPRRWAHSRGVAAKAEAAALALPPADHAVLIAAAWSHDIGYAATVATSGLHQLDGARHLAGLGFPPRVCGLVAHHSGAASVADLVGLGTPLGEFTNECGPVRDALWYCDLTTGPDGLPVSFPTRMAEPRARRGRDDPVVRALAENGEERAARGAPDRISLGVGQAGRQRGGGV